jgi:predicted nuclease with TOPRIM domain
MSDSEQQPQADPDELRREIEETRAELGETVEALSHKADVKSQVQEKAGERKEQLRQKSDELKEKLRGATPESAQQTAGQAAQKAKERPLPLAVIGALAAGFAFGRFTSKR